MRENIDGPLDALILYTASVEFFGITSTVEFRELLKNYAEQVFQVQGKSQHVEILTKQAIADVLAMIPQTKPDLLSRNS